MSMWYEVHRPRSLSDCVLDHLHDDARKLLLNVERQQSVPNLLLWGSPGTGKSTIAGILASDNVFTVNSFNGSSFEKIGLPLLKRLLQSKSLFHDRRCFVLDELHVVSTKVQHEIRAMIDAADVPATWLFTCNDVKAIDDALRSRLLDIPCGFSSVTSRENHLDGIARRYAQILAAEGIDAPLKELRKIAESHYPDVRAGINSLQLGYDRQRAP